MQFRDRCSPRTLIVEALHDERIEEVCALFASHSDADRPGRDDLTPTGAGDRCPRSLRCENPDSMRNRRLQFWNDFKVAVRYAKRAHGTSGSRTELTTETSADLVFGDLSSRSCSRRRTWQSTEWAENRPRAELWSPIRWSAVLRVGLAGEPLVIFAADLDVPGLDRLIEEGTDLRRRVPGVSASWWHSGWKADGRPPEGLRTAPRRACKPETIVFCVGTHAVSETHSQRLSKAFAPPRRAS